MPKLVAQSLMADDVACSLRALLRDALLREALRTITGGSVSREQLHQWRLYKVALPETLQKLRWLFVEPERYKPTVTREAVTQDVAGSFAEDRFLSVSSSFHFFETP